MRGAIGTELYLGDGRSQASYLSNITHAAVTLVLTAALHPAPDRPSDYVPPMGLTTGCVAETCYNCRLSTVQAVGPWH